ncbi:hypothetical protein DC498_02515 [Terrimonas sp.]|uniref:sensor histidine kinase n=1 Tax=Terrimonas sp. TaxID=1914338 RepID=UPI000D511F7F|nr:histidine kinase [Terrimonas sp.]PVD54272.1 hypothetical protein DC498_02515 [Terrimonas sp.]
MRGDNTISVLIIVGIITMLILFTSFLYAFLQNRKRKIQHRKNLKLLKEAQQNQLVEAAIKSEETERHRIAEELHDEVGAILSASKLHFQGIKFANLDERSQQLYRKGEELLDEAIHKVRGISHNLHSNILKEFGLTEAIRHFISKITNGTIIETVVELDSSYPVQSCESDISIYRLMQELVNNILKHAGATRVEVYSKFTNNELMLVILHNGKGLVQEEFEKLRYNKEGLGLKNIQNRVTLLKGKINFSREDGKFKIIVIVPQKILLNEKN